MKPCFFMGAMLASFMSKVAEANVICRLTSLRTILLLISSVSAVAAQTTISLSPTPAWSDFSGWDQPRYYATIQLADIDGDGRAELLGRGPGGILVNHFDTATQAWIAWRPGPP